MRTKTRTTRDIRPGMLIRSAHTLGQPAYREVATVTRPTPWAERLITFTDGSSQLYSLAWEFHVARGKTIRRAARVRTALAVAATPTAGALMLWALLTPSPAGARIACAIVLAATTGVALLAALALADTTATLFRRVSRGSCNTR